MKIWKSLGTMVRVSMLTTILLGLFIVSIPISAAANDYYIYSKFNPQNINDVTGVGGYIEYTGIPEWGDEIQYVYFLSGTTGYKVKVELMDGDGDGKIDPRQHPDNAIPEFRGPIEPRKFTIVSSKDLTGYTAGSSGHSEEFRIDSSGIYLGAYPYGINKWDHNWNYVGKIANNPPERTESLAYNSGENVWYAGGRSRTIYELKDTNNDGSFLDETWKAIFTYPNYAGDHHDGIEYVGGYLWISDMTSDVIGKWRFNPSTSTWEELNKFTYVDAGDVEGMGFGPNDHFWIGSGWGSTSYLYELGNEITKGYPIANAGKDIDNFPPTISIKFDASASHHTDATKQIVSYQWDFESDGTWDSTDKTVERTYPAYYNPDGNIDWDKTKKDYIITLKVTDNSNPVLTDTDTIVVHITAPPWKPVAIANPLIMIPFSKYSGTIGKPVQLDGSLSFDPEQILFCISESHPWCEKIAKYEWDLDNDGKFDDSTDVKPTWTWNNEGTYNVGLIVTDSQPSGPGGTFGDKDISDKSYATVVIKEPAMIAKIIEPNNGANIAEKPAEPYFNGKKPPTTDVEFKGEILCDNCQPPYTFQWVIDDKEIITRAPKNEKYDEMKLPFKNSGNHKVKLIVHDNSNDNKKSEDIVEFNIKVFTIYIPVNFKDGKSPHKSISELKDLAKIVKEYYEKESYGKEILTYNFLEDDWIQLLGKYQDLGCGTTWSTENDRKASSICVAEKIKSDHQNMIDKLVKNSGFDSVSSIVVITPEGRNSIWPAATIGEGLAIINDISDPPDSKSQTGWPKGIWNHEFGHAQYGFDDHYALNGWALMGIIYPTTLPPIMSYNKELRNWLEYENIFSGNMKKVKSYTNINPSEDKILKYDTTSGSNCVKSYIFEGRKPILLSGLTEYGLENGILMYQIEKADESHPKAIDNRITLGVDLIAFPTLYDGKLTSPIISWNTFTDPNDPILFIRVNLFGDQYLKLQDWYPISLKSVRFCLEKNPSTNGNMPDPKITPFDINLYAISEDKKVGIDKSSGTYDIQIKSAQASGNVHGGGSEWITLPNNIDAYYMLDASFAKKWAEESGTNLPNMVASMQMILYDENGVKLESVPTDININLDGPTIIKLSDLLPYYRIEFLPPLTIANRTNITNGSTLPIKFSIRDDSTGKFAYDDSTKLIITDSKNNMIAKFVNGTGAKNLRISTTDELYIANFNTKNYDLKIGEKYTIIVTSGKDKLLGYAIKDFTVVK